jgi:hypothetical protein
MHHHFYDTIILKINKEATTCYIEKLNETIFYKNDDWWPSS